MKYLVIILYFLAFSSAFSQGKWELAEEIDREKLGWEPNIQIKAKKIVCSDSMNCTYIGMYGGNTLYVYTTSDGGESWEMTFFDTTTSGKFVGYRTASFAGYDLCIIGMEDGSYWRGFERLSKWERLKLDTNIILSVKIIDSLNGFISVAGENPYKVLVTKDGYKSFDRLKIDLPDSLKGYYIFPIEGINSNFFNKDTIIFRASKQDEKKGYLLTTYDECKTVSVTSNSFSLYSDYQFSPTYFFNDKHGFACANLSENIGTGKYTDWIYETYDGGQTWIERAKIIPGSNGPFIKIDFLDSLNGYAFNYNWKLWKTTDGGKSWYKDTTYNSKNIGDGGLIDITYLNKRGDLIGITTEQGSVYIQRNIPATSVDVINNLAADIHLFPNPLPSGSELTLEFTLAAASDVRIELTDMLGRSVGEAYSGYVDAGRRTLRYKPDGDLPAGIYFLSLKTNCGIITKSLYVIK